MLKKIITLFLFAVSPMCIAETKYIDAHIERVESCKSSGGAVLLFFRDVRGANPNTTNGCSNDQVLPYVRLNSTSGQLNDFEKVMLSMALAAQTSESEVRVRFDDETNIMFSIATK